MPRFNKKENELESHFEKWLYFLKHLIEFENIPRVLNEPVFEKGFKIAEIAALDQNQFKAYENSLKVYWDITNIADSAFDNGKIEGLIEGKIEGKIETAKKMLNKGFSIEDISELTGFSISEIEKLK